MPDPLSRLPEAVPRPANRNAGGPHDHLDAVRDIARGRMDGFMRGGRRRRLRVLRRIDSPTCSLAPHAPDVMGYHDCARDPELLEVRARLRPAGPHVPAGPLLEPARAPVHGLRVVGEMRAEGQADELPRSGAGAGLAAGSAAEPDRRGADYAWTDLTYLLHKTHVSWRYYVSKGTEPDCERRRADLCAGAAEREDAGNLEPAAVVRHRAEGPRAWKRQLAATFYNAARTGTLPAVSWITPARR